MLIYLAIVALVYAFRRCLTSGMMSDIRSIDKNKIGYVI
jgi:hypothetical protein